MLRKVKLTTWIFIALIVGLLLGHYAPEFSHSLKSLRTLFLNGVKCIIAPLIFASIVLGINSAGSVKGLGRTGVRAIIYFEIATPLALVVGLFMVNWLRPGDGISLSVPVSDLVNKAQETKLSFAGFFEHLLPTNFAEAVVKGDVLQIVIFSTIFGIATLLAGEKGGN